MSVVETIVGFILIWWLLFFVSLPIGVSKQQAPIVGTDPGAPARPMLIRKAVATTLISACLTGLIYWLAETGRISLRAFFSG